MKLGQLLSTCPDLPAAYIDELSTLQDVFPVMIIIRQQQNAL